MSWKSSSGPIQEAFQHAVESSDLAQVRRLLEDEGADPNLPRTPNGMVPVHVAAMNLNLEILEVLIQAGAEINVTDDDNTGSSVLKFALQNFMWEPEDSVTVVAFLLADGQITNPHILGPALGFAAGLGMLPMVDLLLVAGADPNYARPEDDYASVPLEMMINGTEAHADHAEIARKLLAAGANPRHIVRGRSILEYADEYERDDLIPLLQEALATATN